MESPDIILIIRRKENMKMETKENAVEKLREAGYVAKLENGVVMIYYDDINEYEKIKDVVRDFLHNQVNYHSSFGIMCAKGKMMKAE